MGGVLPPAQAVGDGVGAMQQARPRYPAQAGVSGGFGDSDCGNTALWVKARALTYANVKGRESKTKQVTQAAGEGVGKAKPTAQAGGTVFPDNLSAEGTIGKENVAGFLHFAQAM